ncbi:hypothetical protein [Halarcobacter sp.]|uniref:hypothetical protein n=1 Tax=Halarcobacter sp. TaxID=2321133 RepID=UPI003A90599A
MKSYSSKWKLTKAYKKLFEELNKTKEYECRTVYEHYVVHNSKPANDKVTVVLRVDVDNGFHLTEPLVHYMNDYGLKASHYFLTHPKRYYNLWHSDILLKAHNLGHEVGIHTDHYYEQLEFGIDGLSTLKEDIKRLSDLIGEPIKGMVYHGHPAINAKGVTNWKLTKDIDSIELGLEYHDGLKSCYIDPKSDIWKPKCDFNIGDFMGFPYSWGWNYWPNYPVSMLKKHGKKGEVIHLAFHTKNAFANYWEYWEDKYDEKPFFKEKTLVFYKKKFIIYFNYLVLPNIIYVLDKLRVKNLIKKVIKK